MSAESTQFPPKSALIIHEHFPKLWGGGDMRILQVAQMLGSHCESSFKNKLMFIGRDKHRILIRFFITG